MSLNKSEIWNPNNLRHAFSLVGGPDESIHLSEVRHVANIVQEIIPNDVHNVLEYGCGFGRVLVEMKKIAPDLRLIGCDFNNEMLKYGLEYTLGFDITLLQSDGKNIPFADESIDFIYTHAVLIHNNPDQIFTLFSEFRRVLKKQGRMYHDFLNGDNADAKTESDSAIKNQFPLYCYSYEIVKFIAEKNGFGVINPDGPISNKKRVSYLFQK